MIKRIILLIWALFIAAIFLIPKAHAITTISASEDSGDVTVESNETIDDNLATAGNNVYIRGVIEDDLFVAGANIKIEGEIKGNLFAAGNTVTISGKVHQDAFLGGNMVTIEDKASVGRDLLAGGNLVLIEGNVERNVLAGAANLDINGTIEGDVKAGTNSLNLGDNAKINGKLEYSGEKEIEENKTSKVQGEVKYDKPQKTKTNFTSQISGWFVGLVKFLFVGILLVLLLPKWFDKIADVMGSNTLKSIGIGFLMLIIAPIIALIGLIILIGMPIAFIIGLIYILLLYIAKYWVAYCLGKTIGKGKWSPIITMIVGVVILQIIFLIPYIGVIAKFVVILAALGAIYLSKPLVSAKNK